MKKMNQIELMEKLLEINECQGCQGTQEIKKAETEIADTLEHIKTLPPELREKINKDFIKIKLRERKDLGWVEVHKELEKIPFCKRRESFVKAMFCVEHLDCGVDGICVPCMRKGNINHYVTPDIDEYKNLINYIEICDDDLEHEWIQCKLKGLDPMREIIRKFY